MKLRFMDPKAEIIVPCVVTFQEPGQAEGQAVTLRVKILPAEEAARTLYPAREQILEEVRGGAVDVDPAVRLMRTVIVGWDEADVGVPFSAEALEGLVAYAFARNQFVEAYQALASGVTRKN